MRVTGPLIYKQLLFLILGTPFSSALGYYLVQKECCSVVSKSSCLFPTLIFLSLTNICFIPLIMDHGYPEPLSLKILSFQLKRTLRIIILNYTLNQFQFCYQIQNILSRLSNKLILRLCMVLNISSKIDENLQFGSYFKLGCTLRGYCLAQCKLFGILWTLGQM